MRLRMKSKREKGAHIGTKKGQELKLAKKESTAEGGFDGVNLFCAFPKGIS